MQLYFTIVLYNCILQLYFIIVFYNCILQLYVTIVFYNCILQLYFTITFYNCILQLYFTILFYNCILPTIPFLTHKNSIVSPSVGVWQLKVRSKHQIHSWKFPYHWFPAIAALSSHAHTIWYLPEPSAPDTKMAEKTPVPVTLVVHYSASWTKILHGLYMVLPHGDLAADARKSPAYTRGLTCIPNGLRKLQALSRRLGMHHFHMFPVIPPDGTGRRHRPRPQPPRRPRPLLRPLHHQQYPQQLQ